MLTCADAFRISRRRSNSSLGSGNEPGSGEVDVSHERSNGVEDGGSGDDDVNAAELQQQQQQQQQINQLKAKLRESEQIIATAKHKEVRKSLYSLPAEEIYTYIMNY